MFWIESKEDKEWKIQRRIDSALKEAEFVHHKEMRKIREDQNKEDRDKALAEIQRLKDIHEISTEFAYLSLTMILEDFSFEKHTLNIIANVSYINNGISH